MAAQFDEQISAQIESAQKQAIEDLRITDGRYQADVVRVAIDLGMNELLKLSPAQRQDLYARGRRGSAVPPQATR